MKHYFIVILTFLPLVLVSCISNPNLQSSTPEPLSKNLGLLTTITTSSQFENHPITPSSPPTQTIQPKRTLVQSTQCRQSLTPENTITPSFKGYSLFDISVEDNIKYSPDGKWLWSDNLVRKEGDWQSHEIHIVSVDGKFDWWIKPQAQDIHRELIGEIWYEPYYWFSGNHPYLFLVGRVCCLDGPGIALRQNTWGLFRLDLTTGKFSILVPFTENGYIFSFSPQGKYLLMEKIEKEPFQIMGLPIGQINSITIPKLFERPIEAKWSPDEKYVALQICGETIDYLCNHNRVIIIDPENLSFKVVVDNIQQALELTEVEDINGCNLEWNNNSKLIINCVVKQLKYDAQTGKTNK